MGWIIFTVIVILGIALAAWLRGRFNLAHQTKVAAGRGGSYDDDEKLFARLSAVAMIVLGIAWVAITLASCVDQVDNGHVGLIYQFGSIDGQRNDAGIVYHAPWQSVEQVNTQVIAIQPQGSCSDPAKTAHCLNAASNEAQDVFIQPVVRLHVNVSAIQGLYRTVGPNWQDVLVESDIAQFTKEQTAKYKSTDIIPNREALRVAIRDELNTDLGKYSITVDDFLLNDIHFSDAFNAAIEAKVQAEQNAVTEQNNVAIHEAKAQQAVADAKGQADAQVTLAKGQADANNLINASLTDNLIQWQTVNKLGPDVKVILLPAGGNGLILDMGGLTGTTSDQPTK